MKSRIACALAALVWVVSWPAASTQLQSGYEVRQLTFGPAHHFYGYIGHVGNSPYSADGRHLVALRTTFQDRMPGPEDAADIVLLDATRNYAETKVEETRGWNPQQGAMIYWNPDQPSRQFFFRLQPRRLYGRRPAHRPGAVLESRGRPVRLPRAGEGRHAADVRSPRPSAVALSKA